MSVLSAQSIRRIKPVEPFVERGVSNGKTYGLSSATYDIRVAQTLRLPPRSAMTLVSSMEYFTMPNNVCGNVKDKSSWVRQGLTVQNTLIDPGWCGYLTLELTNHSDVQLAIFSGDPIAQVKFEWLDEPTELPYKGKYQNQEAGPQVARHDRA